MSLKPCSSLKKSSFVIAHYHQMSDCDIEKLQVAKEYISLPPIKVSERERAEALSVVKTYYRGVSIRSVHLSY